MRALFTNSSVCLQVFLRAGDDSKMRTCFIFQTETRPGEVTFIKLHNIKYRSISIINI